MKNESDWRTAARPATAMRFGRTDHAFFSLLLNCEFSKRPQKADARKMEIVIAPDKFKGTLTAAEAAGAIADGIDRAARRAGRTDVRLILKPMADGGEGSLAILAGNEGEYHPVETFDALMRPVQSAYAVLPGSSGKRAAVEAASAVGLYRLDKGERNPLRTTSYGLGTVIREAIGAGCTELIAAVGGTATSDCGAGMLAALGCRFLDERNRPVEYPAGGDLIRFDTIDAAPLYRLTKRCRFKVLCDVDNPLTGPRGAAAVFAPQKGADAAAVALLEAGAEHFAAKAAAVTGHDCRTAAGSGAAGGIAWALKSFCGADFIPGAASIAALTGTDAAIRKASLAVTGEGRFDSQSLHGKVAGHVASFAHAHGIPAIVLCGSRGEDMSADLLAPAGISALFALTDRMPPHEAFSRPSESLARLSAEVFGYLLSK